MNLNLEHRCFGRKVEIRSVNKPGYLPKGLSGYAVVYESASRDFGGFHEVIKRGALTESLTKGLDVRLLFQHDSKQVMARESAGNLRLREDEVGIYFEADLVDNTLNRDTLASIDVRNLDAMSFGMPPQTIVANFQKAKPAVRTITKTDMVEISVVTWAAYEATTVRALAEYQTFMQQDAAGQSTPVAVLRARHELAKRQYRY